MPTRFLRLNWSERNFSRLKALLADTPMHSCAVFDWDNTCIFNDCGDAFFRHQLFNLDFRLSVAEFAAHLPTQVNGVMEVEIGGQRVALATIGAAIAADYAELSACRSHGGRWRDLPVHQRFAVALLALNEALERAPDIGCRFAYDWLSGFLAHFAIAEVERLAQRVFADARRQPIQRRALASADGRLTYSFLDGMRVYPEVRNLMRVLRQRGVDVYVITATSPYIVAAICRAARYPVTRVIGMQSALDGDSILAQRDPAYAVNYGAGKVDNIRRFLPAEPLLVAGDSDGDVEMLGAFGATRARLIVNRRLVGSRISGLYQQASAGANGYLLQDIDDSQGCFVR